MFASAAVVAIVSNAMLMQAGHHPSPMFGKSVAASSSVSVVTMPRSRPADPRADTKALDQSLLQPSVTELKAAEPKSVEIRSADARTVEARQAEPKHLDIRTADTKTADTKPADAKPVDSKRTDSHARARSSDADDPLGSLVRNTATPRAQPMPQTIAAASSSASSGAPRPPGAIPNASRDPVGDMNSSSRRVAAVQRVLTDYGYGQLKPTGQAGSDTQAAIQRFERARRLPVTGQVSERLVRELGVVTGRPID
jgi:hypothetical protein